MEGAPKSPENKENAKYPEIASEIVGMAERDQEMRMNVAVGAEWDHTIDIENTERMKVIVAEIGWPTKSKVGEWPSYKAWLLVQHAMHDQSFMKHCLELMEAEPASEVDPQNIAYLSDRLKVAAGEPQIYGTQYRLEEGKPVPFEIEDPEHVDDRRQAIGLESLEEYLSVSVDSMKEKEN